MFQVARIEADSSNEKSNDSPENRQLLRDVTVNGIVLLKNKDILPLRISKYRKIAIIGPNATKPTAGGVGRVALAPHYMTTHKLLPVPGDQIMTPDSKRMGLQIDFHAGFYLTGKIAGTRFWSSSNIFLMTDEDVPDALKCTEYSFRLSGILTVTETGKIQIRTPQERQSSIWMICS
jgi:hypothetical protein